ncbi:hypothetical protein BT96DRAFT_1025445 [Gymnopus androsaceus JB14]|uniref:PX domain-containing protein n=1 Tax=Gymnopus androsaceus JB14 TaxID=1447944 RepID=A0A6A4GRP7_9AGAR|nr:hypothetical protein BT96DRAFT_1025445 [Gymnopus androsaceus JB14]
MAVPPLVTINAHTTASSPRPHILYAVRVTRGGKDTVVHRRYSEFIPSITRFDLLKNSPPFFLQTHLSHFVSFLPPGWLYPYKGTQDWV